MTDLAAELSADARALLERMGPGVETLGSLRAAMLAGALGPARNRLTGRVDPPEPGDVLEVPADPGRREALRTLGEEALRRGHVGLVLLNGGMATRFGGVVKGVVKVHDELSFLGMKLVDALRAAERAGGQPPVVMLMNSRATAEATAAHLEENQWFGYPRDRVWSFEQQWSVRLTPDGSVFRAADGAPSFYGPGHGDLGPCLRRSGLLERFRADGGAHLLMSNVDNVLATLDPILLGLHVEHGARITVEAVDKQPGDAGGAPARVDGRLQVVESFRFPEGFDQDRIPVFNTNTFWFAVEALAEEAPLTWFLVQKKVDDLPVIQFERLVGELTASQPSVFVRVSREGSESRFIPIKSPEDLEQTRASLVETWQRRVGPPV